MTLPGLVYSAIDGARSRDRIPTGSIDTIAPIYENFIARVPLRDTEKKKRKKTRLESILRSIDDLNFLHNARTNVSRWTLVL